MKIVKNKKELSILLSMALLLISILFVNGHLSSKAENHKLPEVVFYVS
jgi:hypothetical protein